MRKCKGSFVHLATMGHRKQKQDFIGAKAAIRVVLNILTVTLTLRCFAASHHVGISHSCDFVSLNFSFASDRFDFLF